MLERAVQKLLERLEAASGENGKWKLAKVLPGDEFRGWF